MARRHSVRLRLVPGGIGSSVEVDERQLRGVHGVSVTAGMHEHVTVTVDLRVHELELESGQTTVQVPEATAETLVALGWTPPEILPAER